MSQGGTDFVAGILQSHRYNRFLFGEGEEERVFEAFLHTGSFFFAQPFLEQAGERGAVNHRTRCFVLHGYFAIACQWQFAEVMAASCPLREAAEFV